MLDCDLYRNQIPIIKYLTKDKNQKERIEMIGVLANATFVHVIIISCYLGEIYGFTPELYATIDRLKKFYKIKDIKNIKTE